MLAIAGGKGGCGKTTTTLGLAAALARDGRRPLAVDADLDMPNLHAAADVPQHPGLPALGDGTRVADLVRYPPSVPGVALLPAGASSDPAAIAPDTAERLRGWDGPVLVDCPAGAATDAASPLRAAEETLLVAAPTPACLRDTTKTAAMARALDAPPLGVVLVEHGEPLAGEADRVTDSDARRLFDCPLLGTVPAARGPVFSDPGVRCALDSVARKCYERKI